MKTALITGASSGIGLELARVFASNHTNLVLVARNLTRLDQLKIELEKKYKIKVLNIEKDLSKREAPFEVFTEVQNQKIHIDFLVNNAGFGDFGPFYQTNLDKELAMIDLNITALTQLTKFFLKEMIKHKSGRIMNVASTASFQPGPNMAIYFATKSYVLSFSEAINVELRKHGITVTALCPGPTESGFQLAAGIEESKLVKDKKLPSSMEVAMYGYKAMIKGKSVAIHGFMNRLMANSVRFFPRDFVANLTAKIQEKAE
jgi:short-subunit dehydrogenase